MSAVGGGSFHQDWLSEQELVVARQLERASLVVEINLDENRIKQIQEIYGIHAREKLRLAAAPDAVIREYPALTLAVLVGHAAIGYEQNRYWDDFFEILGLERTQSLEQEFRKWLRRLISRFGLRDFPELEHDYVQLMALHAAFPVYCMADVVRILEERLSAGTEVSGAAVIEWLRQPGKKHRMGALDVPVRNFIRYGGDLAIDLLDRIIDFIAFTVHDKDWSSSDIDLDTSTTGLPTVLLERLVELLEEQPFGRGSRAPAPPRRRRRKPGIVLSPLDRQVLVQVPYPDVDPGSPWRVSFDGITREVLAEPGWGITGKDEHPPTPVPVPSAVREILLQHPGSGETASIDVVDKSDPLLLFDLDGKRLSRRSILPRDLVYALHPGNARVVEHGTREPIETVTASGAESSVTGWQGWVLSELDLSGARSIALLRDAGALSEARTVRDAAAPVFEDGEPITGIETLNGLTVFGTRPTITIPERTGTSDIVWTVRVKRPNSMSWLLQNDYESEDEDTLVDPFADWEDAVLGQFEIQVTGPVGSDLRHQTFVAEGISVDFSVPVRSHVSGGLKPTTATIESEWDLVVDTPRIEFGASDREKMISIRRSSHAYRLRVVPPYVRVRSDVRGQPAQWRVNAGVLVPAELDEDRIIGLHADGVESAVFEARRRDGTLLKDVTPATPHYQYFESSSRVFYDVIRNEGPCQIVAQLDDENGDTTTVVICHVRPAALCSRVTLDGGDLVLHDPADEEDLAVNIWARTAPWRPVLTVPVENGRARMSAEYLGAGSLLVDVFVDDPWVTITPPAWPGETALSVDQPGWMHDDDRGRNALSRFLAGEGLAPSDAIDMPEVWSALAVLPQDSEDVQTQRLRSALSRLLKDNPRASLEAMGNSTVGASDMVSLLIRTGLVYKDFRAEFTLNDLHPDPWVGCMIEIADLPSLWARKHEVAAERLATLDYLADKGGDVLIDLLRVGKSHDAYAAVFESGTLRLDAMPTPAVERIIEESRLVPGALLDVDTRMAGAITAFQQRHRWTTDGWSQSFGSATLRALDTIKRT